MVRPLFRLKTFYLILVEVMTKIFNIRSDLNDLKIIFTAKNKNSTYDLIDFIANTKKIISAFDEIPKTPIKIIQILDNVDDCILSLRGSCCTHQYLSNKLSLENEKKICIEIQEKIHSFKDFLYQNFRSKQ